VVSEITEVIGEKTPAVEQKVETALEHCFAVKARNAARAKVVKPVHPKVPVPITRVSAKTTRAARAS
jgi:hypothetical protein